MLRLLLKPRVFISALIMLAAMVAVACGSDATATPRPAAQPADTAVPAPTVASAADVGGEPKVETLVLGFDPAAGETNLHWAGTIDHHQQIDDQQDPPEVRHASYFDIDRPEHRCTDPIGTR